MSEHNILINENMELKLNSLTVSTMDSAIEIVQVVYLILFGRCRISPQTKQIIDPNFRQHECGYLTSFGPTTTLRIILKSI
jgi:hypothetical protein